MKYQICTKTVMDTSDPSIVFDKDGISNHYWRYQLETKKHWQKNGEAYLDKFFKKLKDKNKKKEYDCIIGLSGGLDSSYMLHLAIKEFGLRPLVFHTDCGWNTDTAVHNINCLIESLKLDLYTEVVDWEQMKDFQLALFKSGLPHLDLPQDHAFVATQYHFANKYNIKYILNGWLEFTQ